MNRMNALLVLAWLFCPAGLPDVRAQTLKVPYVSVSPTNGPLWIAKEARLFTKYGVPDVQLVYIPGGTVIIQSMIAGEASISNMAPPAALAAWVKGADFAVVGSAVNRLLETVVTRADIKTPKDLKGRKVGIGRYGSLTDAAFREALRYYSLVPDKEVVVIQAGSEGSRLAALAAGALDGAMLSGPERIQAEKWGFHVLIDFSKLPLEFPNNGIIVRRDFIRSNREVLKRFLKAWVEGIKIFKTDPALSLNVLAGYLRVQDKEVLAKSYEPYPPVFERLPFPKRDGFVFALDRLSKEMPEAAKMNIDTFIDNSIIQELEKEGFVTELYGEKTK
jgi:NitT/TauT family transport system substrate-binding protein